jgi:hypothetical protein
MDSKNQVWYTPPMGNLEDQVEEVREGLRQLIRQDDRSYAWIDRKLGWTDATASQLMRGRIKLQVMHVFQILELFNVEPEDFFGTLYGKPVETARRMMARRSSQAEISKARPTSPGHRLKEPSKT